MRAPPRGGGTCGGAAPPLSYAPVHIYCASFLNLTLSSSSETEKIYVSQQIGGW